MNPGLKELIELRLNKADRAIEDAKILIGGGSFFGAINRIYYAVFYAARALLATKELDSSKHSGIISFFHHHFVKEKVVSQELGGILVDLFKMRTEGDYKDNKIFSKQEVDEYFVLGNTFIAGIKQVLEKIKNEEK